MDETKWLALFVGGIACLFAALVLYGLITDLRRGRTGILMVILSPCIVGIVGGLFFYDRLAIISKVLFAVAWIAGLLEKKFGLLDEPPDLADSPPTQKEVGRGGVSSSRPPLNRTQWHGSQRGLGNYFRAASEALSAAASWRSCSLV